MKTKVRNDFFSEEKVETFSRYEFKYLLNETLREEIEKQICQFMKFDGFAHREMENCYLVRSLYFDNDLSSCYYEKVEGIKTRMKFRIRTYKNNFLEDAPIFLEQKGRHNERTFKNRIKIADEDLELLLSPSCNFVRLKEKYKDIRLIEQFIFDVFRKLITPKVLVDYKRRPYTSPFDVNFRITFDSTLRAVKSRDLFETPHFHWKQGEAGYTIMEVKFFRRIPAWFHTILQAYELRRLSISKFCKGMEITGIASEI